jgi:hypothetical protein
VHPLNHGVHDCIVARRGLELGEAGAKGLSRGVLRELEASSIIAYYEQYLRQQRRNQDGSGV